MNPVDFPPLMREALKEALMGLEEGEVPVGALLAGQANQIVARAHNQPRALKDPSAHAEILVLRKAGGIYGNYRFPGTTLVVTVEPCPMCMGAALHARVARIVFGAFDPKWGAAGSLYSLHDDRRLNHHPEVVPGILGDECARLMQDFFKSRRSC
jgi:tRNA(adenine34) deaminase